MTTTPSPTTLSAEQLAQAMPLMRTCRDAADARAEALEAMAQHELGVAEAKEAIRSNEQVINVVRSHILNTFPGVSGRDGHKRWSVDEDYVEHGNTFIPSRKRIDILSERAALSDPEAANPLMVEHKLYSEKASMVRTMLACIYDRTTDKKPGSLVRISFGTLCDVMNLLDPTPSPMPAPTHIGIDLGGEAGDESGTSTPAPVYEHYASEWHNLRPGDLSFGHAVLDWRDGVTSETNYTVRGYGETKLYREVTGAVVPEGGRTRPERSNRIHVPDEPAAETAPSSHPASSVRVYADGTVASGPDNLPEQSPGGAPTVALIHPSQADDLVKAEASAKPAMTEGDSVRLKGGKHVMTFEGYASTECATLTCNGKLVVMPLRMIELVPEEEGGDPTDDDVEGTADDLRPLIEFPARRLSLTFTHPTVGDDFFTPLVLEAMSEFAIHMHRCEVPTLEKFDAPEEPRYPYTCENGVVVDVLAWKSVEDMGGLPAFPFMGGDMQMALMVEQLREKAVALCGVDDPRPDMLDASPAPHPFDGKMIRPKGAPDMAPAQFVRRDGEFLVAVNAEGKTWAGRNKDEDFEVVGDASGADTPSETIYVMAADNIEAGKSVRVNVEAGLAWQSSNERAPAPETVIEPSGNRGVSGDGGSAVGAGRNEWYAGRFSGETLPQRAARLTAQGWTPEHIRETASYLNVHGDVVYPEVKSFYATTEPEPAPMQPTIGRRVWFWPAPRSGASNFISLSSDLPMDAGIVFVWRDDLVNLDVTDHNGNHHAITSVRLVRPGATPPNDEAYAEWMPFQIKQAGKQ